jgi:hypothetical protein
VAEPLATREKSPELALSPFFLGAGGREVSEALKRMPASLHAGPDGGRDRCAGNRPGHES